MADYLDTDSDDDGIPDLYEGTMILIKTESLIFLIKTVMVTELKIMLKTAKQFPLLTAIKTALTIFSTLTVTTTD
jgi:hypothetical protein